MIDEDGCHVRRIGGEKWKAIYVNLNGPKKLCHYLHVRRNCRYLDLTQENSKVCFYALAILKEV